MPRTKTQKILRYVAYGALGLGVLAFLLYVFVFRTIQIHNQKQNFAKAEASLDSLEQQIESKIGKPDQIKKEKSCDRANLLGARGPLGCEVSIYLLYSSVDTAEANEIMKTLSATEKSELRIGSGAAKHGGFVASSEQKGEQTFYQSFDLNSPLQCSYGYTYPAVDHEAFAVTSKENLQISIGCGGPAMAEFYPVKS